jgi:DNA-binding MarR family transcriptional regulator
MPIGAAVSFLLVAISESVEGGLLVTELSRKGGFSLSSASRYVQTLGEIDRHGRPGHKLVSAHVDIHDRRRKNLRLTPKGRDLVHDIVAAV